MSDSDATEPKAQEEETTVADTEEEEMSTLTPDDIPQARPDFGPFQSATNEPAGKKITSLKLAHLDEITELRNELDEMKTKCMIIETTKQDELDEISFKAKQEIDSLNHIINALTNDLSSIRNEYDSRTKNYKELKKQQQLQQNDLANQSAVRSSTGLANTDTISLRNSPHNTSLGGTSSQNPSYLNITQENENLEEDMRKAKESADMLRSVVLPLETEISTLRTRSDTSEKRMKELEKIIEQHSREKELLMEEEKRIVDECTNVSEGVEEHMDTEDKVYFNKYLQLKKYLYKKDAKFIELEQANLKAIRKVYSMLSPEQKQKLIISRPKSKSLLSNKSTSSSSKSEKPLEASSSEHSEHLLDEEAAQGLNIKKNIAIDRIEELLSSLVTDVTEEATSVSDKTSSTSSLTPSINELNLNYVELLALYEKEKSTAAELETSYNQKAKDSNKNVENLNKEMNNLATIIDDLRKQYLNMQNQFQYQLDSLIKLNEDLRTELQRSELRNESYKSDNLRLKAENKQFYGEQTILSKDFEDQYQPQTNLDESNRQLANLRADMVKLVIANQALNRQHQLSLETVKHLQKANLQYQRSDNGSDQMVLLQSLESELERERKVRIESEAELREHKSQIKLIKDKSQTLIDSLRQRNDHYEFEQRKLKEESLELSNQIQSLKKDAKNNLSVQEDLVRLIQSLQIELNQTKSSNSSDKIEVRCQHEDDFKECANCNAIFSMSKRKHRCQHCCKLFCAECCAKTVLSGPNQRPHKVCESCHTLLDKTSASSKNS